MLLKEDGKLKNPAIKNSALLSRCQRRLRLTRLWCDQSVLYYNRSVLFSNLINPNRRHQEDCRQLTSDSPPCRLPSLTVCLRARQRAVEWEECLVTYWAAERLTNRRKRRQLKRRRRRSCPNSRRFGKGGDVKVTFNHYCIIIRLAEGAICEGLSSQRFQTFGETSSIADYHYLSHLSFPCTTHLFRSASLSTSSAGSSPSTRSQPHIRRSPECPISSHCPSYSKPAANAFRKNARTPARPEWKPDTR